MASFSPKELLDIARSLGWRTVWLRAVYPLRRRRYERSAPPPATPAGRVPLGDVLGFEAGEQQVDLRCTHGALRLEALAEDLVRFRLLPPGTAAPAPFSYALDPAAVWQPVACSVETTPEAVTLRTAGLACVVSRSPCRLTFLDALGQPLSHDSSGFAFEGAGAGCGRHLDAGVSIHGLAERALDLDLRGQRLEMWNTDPSCYLRGNAPLYLNIPFFVALRDGRAHGFFLDNPGRARFDLGSTRPDEWRYQADYGELCGYFFGGPTLPGVLSRYTQLTGRTPLPPRWMLGYQQSRWSYYPEAEVRRLAAEFRTRRIPCDVLYLDIHYMDGYRVHTWDAERFPDPARLISDLREQGLRVITTVDSGVKVDPGYAVYQEGIARSAFVRMPGGEPFRGPVWPGDCHFPDLTDPAVREWWGGLQRGLLDAGVAGIWNDMNEPAIFGGDMPVNAVHAYEGRGARHAEVHNVYGLEEASASAEGARRLRPSERVPVISRSGYAGIQRHAVVWTGDNHSTWDHLRLSVSMCLNLGLSGVSMCGADVGGFAGNCDGELLARWTQVGALTPFFRNHSAMGTAHQEPWTFGEPYESVCRRWIELRYELLPYLYTIAWEAAQTGLPLMRPLALAYPEDRLGCAVQDQFLLGGDLLAAPVLAPGQTSRAVYLPGGTWYDFWTGAAQRGEIEAAAPLERMPLYVRAGAVLPMAPVMLHTGEWPPAALRLRVYAGEAESWLYEDDGHSLAYRAGEFRLTRFACRDDGCRLGVERRVEGPFNPGYERFEIEVYGLCGPERAVRVDGQAVKATWDLQTGTARFESGAWSQVEI